MLLRSLFPVVQSGQPESSADAAEGNRSLLVISIPDVFPFSTEAFRLPDCILRHASSPQLGFALYLMPTTVLVSWLFKEAMSQHF